MLGPEAAEIIRDPETELLVSAASAWEIATKVRRGRLPEAQELERNFLEDMTAAGLTLREITVADALRAGRFPGSHRDPIDRMIAAQAIADDIPVISIDAKLDMFRVRRIW